MQFRLSPSYINLYMESQITWFIQCILKLPPEDRIFTCYGKAGNVVHKVAEDYIKNKDFSRAKLSFDQSWDKGKLDSDPGFGGKYLNRNIYWAAAIFCFEKIDKDFGTILSEQTLTFELDGVIIKGIIDGQAVTKRKTKDFEKGESVVLDWKTSSRVDHGDNFKRQALHYCYLIWKVKGYIPKRVLFYYAKIKKIKQFIFFEHNLLEYEKFLQNLIKEMNSKGDNIDNYEIGTYSGPFNSHKTRIREEIDKRKLGNRKLNIVIVGEHMYLKNSTPQIDKLVMKTFQYEVPNKFFVMKAMQKRGVMNYDGIKRFYNINTKVLPVGFINSLRKLFFDNKILYQIIDNREVLKSYNIKYKNPKELWDHQKKAIDYAMKNRVTFLQLATGAGKTAIAAELIKRNSGLALFIVDRNILLDQTKKVFEDYLDTEIGTITEGKTDIKVVNVATIQTLTSLLKQKNPLMIRFLANVKTFIIDEGHTAAAKSFSTVSNFVLNADMRIGMSGTYNRDDGHTMVIESVVGKNTFQVNAEELISKDLLMKPKCWFFKYPKIEFEELEKYSDYYKAYIINHKPRNDMIIHLANKFRQKRCLIITTMIEHGEFLNKAIEGSVFIHGGVSKEDRIKWLEDLHAGKISHVIGTASIIQKGLDLPRLDAIINVTGNVSSITTIQTLGRVLRKSTEKLHAYYIDFYDYQGKYFQEHTDCRIKTLKDQGHEVDIMETIR